MRTFTLALIAGGIAAALYKFSQQAPREKLAGDSPQERLQDLELDSARAGLDPAMSGLGEHEDLLSPATASNPSERREAGAPDLPDLTRGA